MLEILADNKGIGPVKSVGATIDETMAAHGKEVYEAKCTASYVETKFIGPGIKRNLRKKISRMIMNMILNPEEMVCKILTLKKLLMEYNGSPMANQNLTEEEARAVLNISEHFNH
ncbi:MAG: hypothetical protein R2728_04035 [Chitinophagales bacterium]